MTSLIRSLADLAATGVIGAIFFKLLTMTENFFINKIIARVYTLGRKWVGKRPVKHAMFLHYKQRHAAKNPRVCLEANCEIVPYPKSALVREQRARRRP